MGRLVSLGLVVVSLAAAPAPVAQAQRRAFTGNGWGPLHFPMSCDDATAALRRWGRAPASREATGIFDAPAGSHEGFSERTFVTLTWRERGREARAECADYRLKSVAFVSRGFPDERAATAGIAALVARHGAPTIDAPTSVGRVRGWTNATTRLLFFVSEIAGQWVACEEWTAADEPRSW